MSQESPPAEGDLYQVVLNHEEQYSIWPVDRAPPAGWKATGERGTKDHCLAHIAQVWTDMRPLSLRQAMDRAAGNAGSGGDSSSS